MKSSILSIPILAAVSTAAYIQRPAAGDPMGKHCTQQEIGLLSVTHTNGTELRVQRGNGDNKSADDGFFTQPMTDLYPGGFTFYSCDLKYMGWKNGTTVGQGSDSHVQYFGKIMFGSDYAHADGEIDGKCLGGVGKHAFKFDTCNYKNHEENTKQWFRLRDYGLNKVIDYYPQANTEEFHYTGQDIKYFHVHNLNSSSQMTYANRNTGWTMKMGQF